MDYFIAKSVHIIFVVSYFAGLFYIVRLFVYHTENLLENQEPKRSILHQQYSYMTERLWNIITVPALLIMSISGIYILYLTEWTWLTEGWLHIKLVFVLGLYVYHFWCWKMIKSLKKEITRYTSVQLRMFNEIATLILFGVVFAVVLKTEFITNWHWAVIWFLLMGAGIMGIVKLVNKKK